jgi:hypothetical protein
MSKIEIELNELNKIQAISNARYNEIQRLKEEFKKFRESVDKENLYDRAAVIAFDLFKSWVAKTFERLGFKSQGWQGVVSFDEYHQHIRNKFSLINDNEQDITIKLQAFCEKDFIDVCLKIGIIPPSEKEYINKKIQAFESPVHNK